MRTKAMKKMMATGLCALLLCTSLTTTAFANSAQKRWNGVDATGAMISSENAEEVCPVIVEKEVLTFDVPEFLQEYYTEEEQYLDYGAKVTAEYTFFNPSDYTVTATLLFPFGNEPDYAYREYNSETEDRTGNKDTGKFDILINGNPVEKNIRYSLTYPGSQFALETDLALLHDGFLEDEFYTPDMTVTKYVYTASGVDTEKYRAANAAFDVSKNGNTRKIFFEEQSGYHTQKDDEVRVSAWVDENGQSFTVYVIGEPFEKQPEWKFYGDGSVPDQGEIAGSMTYESAETTTMTLREFALQGWSEETGVSETDWYNAVVTEMKTDETHNDYGILSLERYRQGLTGYLMRWYEYETSLAPEERLVNTVTAPIYPGIDLTYEPPVYNYTYLLSPAKTWAAFLELEIHINTPYYLTESTVDGFGQCSEGYVVFVDGLPTQEFEFTLSTEPNPVGPDGAPSFTGKTLRRLIFLCAGVICIAGAFGNLASKGKKKH